MSATRCRATATNIAKIGKQSAVFQRIIFPPHPHFGAIFVDGTAFFWHSSTFWGCFCGRDGFFDRFIHKNGVFLWTGRFFFAARPRYEGVFVDRAVCGLSTPRDGKFYLPRCGIFCIFADWTKRPRKGLLSGQKTY